ncbi:MAG: hypothetical protein J3T61_05725 [Candidatus Brocadiales bacterium]|nr:hypothetical protein [Candidatus Bathyanammoxibius sp.]
MTGSKIMGVFVITLGVVMIGAEILFHDWADWDVLFLGIADIAGGALIIASDNWLIRTRKEAKLARASAEETKQQLQGVLDRAWQNFLRS